MSCALVIQPTGREHQVIQPSPQVLSYFLLLKDNQEEEMPHKKGPRFNPEPVGMFVRLARRTEHILGEPLAFTVALICVVLWLLMGPTIDRGHWQEPI